MCQIAEPRSRRPAGARSAAGKKERKAGHLARGRLPMKRINRRQHLSMRFIT